MERQGFDLATAIRLEGELARWRRLGMRPRLWWRDDDAREPTPALSRLLGVAAGRPLALAVIPDGDLERLAAWLKGERGISIGQHGVDHINRRPHGAPPSEHAGARTFDETVEWLSGGRARLVAAGMAPSFYTPPWNGMEPGLTEALAHLRMPVLSAGENRIFFDNLTYMSAEIDVLRWKGRPRFKGAWRLAGQLARALAARRRGGDFTRPIGLLTHHLAHDEPTWRYLEWAMPWLDERFDWSAVTTPRAIVARARVLAQPQRAIDAMAEMQHV